MYNIEMNAVWTLVDTCLIPMIIYGTESMLLTKTDKEEYDKMLTSALKRILNVSTSTPNYNILTETGYLGWGGAIRVEGQ